ncbi:hypothetical protein L218DRAFT_1003485 [Marasmius fiardii PR-910]|nr:hypothetical protein L218DRAFT_1003485 [Marasmius fiardii PR-910]
MAHNSIFHSASNSNITGGEFSLVGGNQTKNTYHTTNTTGSYNTSNTTNTNSGNHSSDMRNQSRDTHHTYQNYRRMDSSAWNNSVSREYGAHQPWAEGYTPTPHQQPQHYQQPCQPIHQQRAYPQYQSIEDRPKPLPVPRSTPAIMYHSHDAKGYSNDSDQALSDQIMASLNLNPNAAKAPAQVPARSNARTAPPFAESYSGGVTQQPTPTMSAPPRQTNAPRPLPPVEQENPFRKMMAQGDRLGPTPSHSASLSGKSGRVDQSKIFTLQVPAAVSPQSRQSPSPSLTPSPTPSLRRPEPQPAFHSQGSETDSSSSSHSHRHRHNRDDTKVDALPVPVGHTRLQSHSRIASEEGVQAHRQSLVVEEKEEKGATADSPVVGQKPRWKLVKDEHRETGSVKWKVYKYLEASSYYRDIWILLAPFVVLGQLLGVGKKAWMMHWG